ncbi:MAG: universal stress protein [Microscillaceae bacterium]|nr:universal stress protein [Microscillaceae bacterium]MDW8459841.1 universal stress protein [Cytophagales bacterium]
MKRILVPTDFSVFAQNALHVAAHIVRKTNGEIFLLNVNEVSSQNAPLAGFYIDKTVEEQYLQLLTASVQRALDEILKSPELADVKINTLIEVGSLTSKINEVAQRIEADLIVMGTKGASGLEEVLVGSNTERVVRTASVPVLTINQAVEKGAFHKIAFATTLKSDQLVGFKRLAEFQKIFNSKVFLLYLNNPAGFSNDQEMQARYQELVKESGLENTELVTSSTLDEQQAIMRFADEIDADLIVMATHQRQGLWHFLVGSLTEDVVNHSHKPVLSISIKKVESKVLA